MGFPDSEPYLQLPGGVAMTVASYLPSSSGCRNDNAPAMIAPEEVASLAAAADAQLDTQPQQQCPYLLKTIDYGHPRPPSSIALYTSLHESFLVLGSHTNVHIVNDIDFRERWVCAGHKRSVMSVATSDIGYGEHHTSRHPPPHRIPLWSPYTESAQAARTRSS